MKHTRVRVQTLNLLPLKYKKNSCASVPVFENVLYHSTLTGIYTLYHFVPPLGTGTPDGSRLGDRSHSVQVHVLLSLYQKKALSFILY